MGLGEAAPSSNISFNKSSSMGAGYTPGDGGKEIASCIMQMKCGINPEICFDKQWGHTTTLMTQLADKEEITRTLFQSLLLAIEN